MMFAQYFIWGAWWVTLGAYMNASGFDDIIGSTYATQGYAAILTPLFIGVIADRYFSAQRLLGILHLTGAALLYWLSDVDLTSTASAFIFGIIAFTYLLTILYALQIRRGGNRQTHAEKQHQDQERNTPKQDISRGRHSSF